MAAAGQDVSLQDSKQLTMEHEHIFMQQWKFRCEGLFTDVNLVCGPTEDPVTVSAHRVVLCSVSPVFKELIIPYSDYDIKVRDTLGLPDFLAEQLLPFLEYLYTRSMTQFNTTSELINGIYAAEKYCILQLAAKLKSKLEDQLKGKTIHEALPAALAIVEMSYRLPERDEKILAPLAMPIVFLGLEKLLQEGSLTFDILETALMLDKMDIRPPEIELFKIADRWAEAFCITKNQEATGGNKRCALGSIIKYIHFMDIPESIFAKDVYQSGLLTPDEISKIFIKRYDSKTEIFCKDGARLGLCLTREKFQNCGSKRLDQLRMTSLFKEQHQQKQEKRKTTDIVYPPTNHEAQIANNTEGKNVSAVDFASTQEQSNESDSYHTMNLLPLNHTSAATEDNEVYDFVDNARTETLVDRQIHSDFPESYGTQRKPHQRKKKHRATVRESYDVSY